LTWPTASPQLLADATPLPEGFLALGDPDLGEVAAAASLPTPRAADVALALRVARGARTSSRCCGSA
jgi:hypothetical protein